MKKLIMVVLVFAMLITVVNSVQANGNVNDCAERAGSSKYEHDITYADLVINGETVTFNSPAEFCVFGGDTNSDWKTTDETLSYTVDFLNKGGQHPDISHVYVIWKTPVPTETTPAPTETTPAPTETTPAPTETLIVTETPIPTATIEPLPIPPESTSQVLIPVTGADRNPWYVTLWEFIVSLLTK